ncbi:MAG: transporter substrate-binding domain-containing protein [Christensenellales bacterium]
MKRIVALIIAIAMAFVFSACANPSGENQPDKKYVQDKGVLIVGITDFAPMDFRGDDGGWIGFDAEMSKAFAEYLGVEVKFVEIEWDNKIFELDSKSIDCVWNGMTLTDEVQKAMECSNAYCKNAQVVVVPASEADKYKDKDSLSALTFAVESGSAGEKAAVEANFNRVAVQSQSVALMEVAAGTSDACIIDLLMAGAMIGEGTSYTNLTYTVALNSEEYGVGFRKGSDLVKELNKFFAEAYADGLMMETAKAYGVQESIIAQ